MKHARDEHFRLCYPSVSNLEKKFVNIFPPKVVQNLRMKWKKRRSPATEIGSDHRRIAVQSQKLSRSTKILAGEFFLSLL